MNYIIPKGELRRRAKDHNPARLEFHNPDVTADLMSGKGRLRLITKNAYRQELAFIKAFERGATPENVEEHAERLLPHIEDPTEVVEPLNDGSIRIILDVEKIDVQSIEQAMVLLNEWSQ